MKQECKQADRNATSQFLKEISTAAKAVGESVEAFARIRELLHGLGLTAEMEGTAEHVAIEVLSEGAYPLPVGSQGTTIVKNDTNVTVTLKTGSDAPIAFPGGTQRARTPRRGALNCARVQFVGDITTHSLIQNPDTTVARRPGRRRGPADHGGR